MLVPRLFSNLLLLTAHLLLVSLLTGACLCLMLPRTGIQQFYLARADAGLAGLLLVWVGVLLVQWLQQRRWMGAGTLALLFVADGLALYGGVLLMATTGAIPGPNQASECCKYQLKRYSCQSATPSATVGRAETRTNSKVCPGSYIMLSGFSKKAKRNKNTIRLAKYYFCLTYNSGRIASFGGYTPCSR